VLAVLSIGAGWVNASLFNVEKFRDWFEAAVSLPALRHPAFDGGKAVLSVAIAAVGIGIAAYLWFQREELGAFRGLTQRNALARAGYQFLLNKYYLDDLYEKVIVNGIKGPIARATYWFDQNVIDAIVNGVGRGAARAGRFTYDVLDQRIVDGAVNGLASTAGNTGGLLRHIQSGRVQRYALTLFAAVGALSLAVWIFT
jgi:NADH-quinone oxidoreductase subunit L